MSSNRRKRRRRRHRRGHEWDHITKPGTMDFLGRVGLGTIGVVYLLIGFLAFRIAFGDGAERADQRGAIATVAHQPSGRVLLVLLVIGLAVLTVWYAAKAYQGGRVGDGHRGGLRTRVGMASSAFFSATLAVSAGTLVVSTDGRGETSDPATAAHRERQAIDRVLDWPNGKAIVILIALGLAYWGYKMMRRAVHHEYREQFRQVPKYRQQIVDPVGQAGFAAQAVVRWITAWFLFQAAVDHDADEVVGLDGALRHIVEEPYGRWLLLVVALGMAAFGIFRLFDATWRSRTYL